MVKTMLNALVRTVPSTLVKTVIKTIAKTMLIALVKTVPNTLVKTNNPTYLTANCFIYDVKLQITILLKRCLKFGCYYHKLGT